MTFHFHGADLQLTKGNVVQGFDNPPIFCVMLMRKKKQTSIGAWQQQNTRFIYDLKASVIRFGPANCLHDS